MMAEKQTPKARFSTKLPNGDFLGITIWPGFPTSGKAGNKVFRKDGSSNSSCGRGELGKMATSEIMLEETPYLNLTTRGRKTGLKHDIELWFAFEDGKLYFLAHESSHWWKNVVKTPRVEVEVSEIIFEGTGRLVPEKLEQTFELFRRKYGREQVERWYGGGERSKRK